MRILSWNINSIRARLPLLLENLRRNKPDIVCLQEIKVSDDRGFPTQQLHAAGYRSIVYGQSSYNGVAFLVYDPNLQCDIFAFARQEKLDQKTSNKQNFYKLIDVHRGFPNDPVPNEARVISGRIGNLLLVNVYVINGEDIKSDQFALKHRWMDALGNWIQTIPETTSILVVGDFNVAPDDRDVWDPQGLRDRIHCTPEERNWLKKFQGTRLFDLLRVINDKPGFFTWWPYQQNSFEKDEGLRFDLILGDKTMINLIERIQVDREERRPRGRIAPSDHAPIIIDIKDS